MNSFLILYLMIELKKSNKKRNIPSDTVKFKLQWEAKVVLWMNVTQTTCKYFEKRLGERRKQIRRCWPQPEDGWLHPGRPHNGQPQASPKYSLKQRFKRRQWAGPMYSGWRRRWTRSRHSHRHPATPLPPARSASAPLTGPRGKIEVHSTVSFLLLYFFSF